MAESYLTAARLGEAEYTDKKSRFIGHVQSVANEEEAKAFIASVRARYAEELEKMTVWNDPSQVINLSFHVLIADTDRAFASQDLKGQYNKNFVTIVTNKIQTFCYKTGDKTNTCTNRDTDT